MINQYGADAVRLFILSDSPPEKDIQWSDTGVASANKFLQKLWNLNFSVLNRKKTISNTRLESEFTKKIDVFVNKIDTSINNFRFNVSIALFHQLYSLFKESIQTNIDKNILEENLIKFMKLLIPFSPHLAFECLNLLNCKNIYQWPKVDLRINEKINLAVQINGKTRDIVKINKDATEEEVRKLAQNSLKAKKYIIGFEIKKIIFVKNRIINYIILNK